MRALAGALIVLGLLANDALAVGPHSISGLTAAQERMAAASFMPVPPGIVVTQAPCPTAPWTSCRHGFLWIFIHPDHRESALVLHHEIGHVFDSVYMDQAEREEYGRLRRGGYDREAVAFSYALCAMFPRAAPRWVTVDARSGAGFCFRIRPRVHRRVCARFAWWVL